MQRALELFRPYEHLIYVAMDALELFAGFYMSKKGSFHNRLIKETLLVISTRFTLYSNVENVLKD